MKHSILFLLSVVLLFLSSHAQAQLNQGDIVVVGLNPVSDTVHLVPLVDIPAGTTVVITDVGWLSTNAFHASLTGDGRATWTTTALVPKGSLIKLVLGGLDNTPATELTNLTTSASYTSQVVFSGYTVNDPILISGDQIFIYQGLASNPSFIFGLNNSGATVGADNWNTVDTPTLTVSRLPNGTGSQNSLTNGVNAIGLPGGGSQQDNVQYTGPTTATDRATWLARFTASANWTGDNTGSTATSITPGTGIVIATPTTITSLNRVNTSPSNAGTVNWTLTFAAPVTGVTASNFSLSGAAAAGASVGSPTTSNGGVTWNVPVTTSSTDGILTLNLANATGLSSSITTSLPFTGESYTMDKTAPTATIVVADTSLIAGETSLVTITFSEAVTGFTNADLSVANGTLSAVSSGDGGVTWTATLTPTANLTDSTNVITLTNSGVTDVLGNAGVGTTNSNNYAIDTLRPTATIVVADTSLIVGETSLVTITFSEAVTGFTNADLSVANGTLSAVSSGDGGVTWNATLTPTSNVTNATNVITLTNSGVNDGSGNAGTGTTNSNNYAIDTLRPTVGIVITDTALTVGESSLVTFTFSEAVTGFAPVDLIIPNGDIPSVSSSDGGTTWTGTYTPAPAINDATNVITVVLTGVTDTAGNAGVGTFDSGNFTINTLSSNADLSALTTTATGLAPVFAANTLAYTASVPNATTTTTVTATRADANATLQVQINGGGFTSLTSGSASGALALNIGTNLIQVKVTAQDGTTIKTYSVTVTRTPPAAVTFSTGMAASIAVGQPNLTTQNSTASQTDTVKCSGVAISATGKLAVVDQISHRVLIWNSLPTVNGQAADVVVGQTNFTNATPGLTSSTLNVPGFVTFTPDGSKMLVTDFNNRRVLIWNSVPTVNGQAADVVVGQANFTTNANAITAAGMAGPSAVTVTLDGRMLVSDGSNNRVLVFNQVPTTNGASADVVIGQSNMTTGTAGSTAASFSFPGQTAVTADGKLLVADFTNNRVMIFNSIPTANGTSADNVIGQTATNLNTGPTLPAANNLDGPYGIAISPNGQLAISDFSDNRVLIYNTVPTSNGVSANFALGQPDLTSDGAFNPGTPNASATNMAQPQQVTFSSDGRLWVAGMNMRRVMVFGGGAPEILITGNGTEITSGDITPGSGDHTHFPNTAIAATSSRVYTIQNTGSGVLNLTGGTRFAISGTHAAEFAVVTQPPATIAAGGSTTVTVNFTPAGAGTRTATVTVVSDDADEASYTFAIDGNGVNLTDADLSALTTTASGLAPVFGANTLAYTASVPNATTSTTVTATKSEAFASLQVRVNGGSYSSLTSGSPSSALALNVGSNTIDVRVTAPDSVTTKTYTITVIRRSIIQDWRFDNFGGDFSGSGTMANGLDFDLDGKTNLLEFAFGTDPTSGGSGPPDLTMSGTYAAATFGVTGQPITKLEPIANGVDFRAVFIRRADHAAAGLTYTPEFSADMGSWTPSVAVPTVLATSGSFQLVSVPYPHFLPNGKKARFFQVTVTITP